MDPRVKPAGDTCGCEMELERVLLGWNQSSGKLGLLPSPLWGGVGGGGRSKDTMIGPQKWQIVLSARR
jgi:hypothetical protein